MFCNNCGNPVEEGTAFCQNCGSLVSPEEAIVVAEKKTSGNKKIIIGVLAAVVAVVALILVFGGKKYEKVAEDYLKAAQKGKGKEVVTLSIPEKVLKKMCKELDISKSDAYDIAEEYAEEIDGKISFDIKKSESLKKLDKLEDEVEDWYEIDDLDDFRDMMEEGLGEYGFDEDKVKNAYAVEAKITFKYDDGEKESEKIVFIVYKYEGKWYVLDIDLIEEILDYGEYDDEYYYY